MKQQTEINTGPSKKSDRLETLLAPCSWPWLFAAAGARQTKLFALVENERAGLGEGSLAYTASRWTVGCATHRLPFRLAMQYDWLCTQQTHTHAHTHARTYSHTHTHHTYTRFLLLLAAFRWPHFKLAYTSSYAHTCNAGGLNRTRQSKARHIHTHVCSYSIKTSNYKASEQQKHAIQQQVEEGKTAQTSITATAQVSAIGSMP